MQPAANILQMPTCPRAVTRHPSALSPFISFSALQQGKATKLSLDAFLHLCYCYLKAAESTCGIEQQKPGLKSVAQYFPAI